MPPLSFLSCCLAGLSFRCSINLWDECAAMRSCANWNAAASMRNGRNWPGTLQLKEGSRHCARRTDGKPPMFKIGSAACRERVCKYVYISLVAESFINKLKTHCRTETYIQQYNT